MQPTATTVETASTLTRPPLASVVAPIHGATNTMMMPAAAAVTANAASGRPRVVSHSGKYRPTTPSAKIVFARS